MYRYEICSVLGKGSFGQVLKCLDHKTQQYCAVKLIRNRKRFFPQALVEMKILDLLRQNDTSGKMHVIHMIDYFQFRNHLCISFELLSVNLYEFIKQTDYQGVALGLAKKICAQILVSLQFLRSHDIIHCDLKPENILLKATNRAEVKVIDFGSSCSQFKRMYSYIQSRFYRAPEVIMGNAYTCAIDMWSLGCVLAELYMGFPLFPGTGFFPANGIAGLSAMPALIAGNQDQPALYLGCQRCDGMPSIAGASISCCG